MKKTDEEIQNEIIKAMRAVAPETDFNSLNPTLPLRDQMDVDSMDFLNILVRIHKSLGVDIPESDYGKLANINSFVAYLKGKLPE